jgi:hypothetical protein
MNAVKWLLVIFGVLFIAFMATLAGGYYWASTIESVKIERADLKAGGAYPADEKEALLAACRKNEKARAGNGSNCGCIADKAGSEFSRFERLVLTAGFEGSPTKIVALTKGLLDSGLPESEVKSMQADSKKRIDELLQACGLEK